MNFSQDTAFPAPPDRIAEIFSDEGFIGRRVEAAGAVGHNIEITHGPDGSFKVDVRADIPTTIIPSTYRGLVPSPMDMRMVEEWSAPDPDGQREAEFILQVVGLPVRVWGTEKLRRVGGNESVVEYRGTVKSSVPLVGRKIEGAVSGAVGTVVEAGRRIAVEELRGEA